MALLEQGYAWDEVEERRLHARRFGERHIRIIRVDGDDIGVLATSSSADELWVHQIYIRSDHRGKGVGTWCIDTVRSEAREVPVPVRLRVRQSNARAQALYLRLGFIRCGETATHVHMEAPR